MEQVETVVRFNIHGDEELTRNVAPLLHEIKHALARLMDDGSCSVIDLRSIPLAPGEEEAILNALGQGEVVAQLDLLGKSEVMETQFAGVWLVTHYNAQGERVGRFVEITRMPELLQSQTEDMADAHGRLAALLQDGAEITTMVES